jgi:[glutamine synthetase] adenylyltransferase / [glutamine synthetase]-adenylyl-L-tyrosine phosphorylase
MEMTESSARRRINVFANEVGDDTINEFLTRLDDDYFAGFTIEEIHLHLLMASRLTIDRPVQFEVASENDSQYKITIVALDYFSELSMICGLISAFGFNIDAGYIYTFSSEVPQQQANRPQVARRPRRAPAVAHPRKIVDVFTVSRRVGKVFFAEEQAEFGRELESLILLLRDRLFSEARDRLNRWLVEHLDQAGTRVTELDSPIVTSFDNALSERATVLTVRSKDSPAFLYALTNGLAMRGVYIQKARIENLNDEAVDSFYIADRRGNKIASEEEQKKLATAVGLIKQFTQALPAAPDPAKALHHFDQFLDAVIGKELSGRALALFGDAEGLSMLANLLGSSDFLWEDILRIQLEDLLPVVEKIKAFPLPAGREEISKELAAFVSGTTDYSERRAALNRFKDREMFLIDMKRLLDRRVTLADFSNALTDLAEAVVAEACDLCSARLIERHGSPTLDSQKPCAFSLFGLGKFGGREMGYASDLELLFVYEGQGRTTGPAIISNGEFFDQLVEEITRFIEARQGGIFQIDMRLRPHGSAGALASSLANIREYYRHGGNADPFERQALIKLRSVAGDSTLSRDVENHRDEFVYGGEPWDIERALHLRARQIRELVEAGRISVKYSPGGIIDVEYTAQYLQIIHGQQTPEVRTPSTLVALERLRSTRVLNEKEHRTLKDAYAFLRQLQDALRMVRGHSRDVLLPDEHADEFKFLARRLGYHDVSWSESSRHLAEDVRRYRKGVSEIFLGRFKPAEKDAPAFSI